MPCPFCGGKHITVRGVRDEDDEDTFYYFAQCRNCGAAGPQVRKTSKAIFWWGVRLYSRTEKPLTDSKVKNDD